MAYPVIYDVTYSYTGFQEAQGDDSFPGTQLDSDLAGLEDSIDNIALFIRGVLRSDGALQNGIVTYDSLSTSLLSFMNLPDLPSTDDLAEGLFLVTAGTAGYVPRAIIGSDLPPASALDMGAVLGLPATAGSVLSGIGADGIPTRATTAILLGSSSATALAVGRTANYAFQVDTSAANSITGIGIASQSAGNGVNITAQGETNVPLIINGAGNGTINFGTTSTGVINFFQNTFLNHNSTPTFTFGNSGNTKGTLTSQGSGGFEFKNSSGNIIAAFLPVGATGQVNYPRFRSNVTLGGVILDAVGTDADIGFSIVAKGSGSLLLSTGGGVAQLQVTHTASTTRWITITGSNGGNPTLNTTAGDLAVTPNVVAAGFITSSSLKFLKTVTAINFNSANTDNAFALPAAPAGFTRYSLRAVIISGASANLSAATVGVFTATAAGGTALVASGTAVTVTSTADSTANNMQALSPVNVNTMSNLYSALTSGTIYFRVQTAAGAPATANVTIEVQWLP